MTAIFFLIAFENFMTCNNATVTFEKWYFRIVYLFFFLFLSLVSARFNTYEQKKKIIYIYIYIIIYIYCEKSHQLRLA